MRCISLASGPGRAAYSRACRMDEAPSSMVTRVTARGVQNLNYCLRLSVLPLMRRVCIAIWCVCVCAQALVVPEGSIAHRSRASPLRPAASPLHATSKVCVCTYVSCVLCIYAYVCMHTHAQHMADGHGEHNSGHRPAARLLRLRVRAGCDGHPGGGEQAAQRDHRLNRRRRAQGCD
jgi:hypothetical protein